MVLLLPVTKGPGITGELCWVRVDRAALGKDGRRVDRDGTTVELQRCN